MAKNYRLTQEEVFLAEFRAMQLCVAALTANVGQMLESASGGQTTKDAFIEEIAQACEQLARQVPPFEAIPPDRRSAFVEEVAQKGGDAIRRGRLIQRGRSRPEDDPKIVQ